MVKYKASTVTLNCVTKHCISNLCIFHMTENKLSVIVYKKEWYLPKLFRTQLLESRNNSSSCRQLCKGMSPQAIHSHIRVRYSGMLTCCNGNQFQFNTTNPSDSWQLSMHQQMIGFIIKTPLTNNQGCTSILQKIICG